MGLGTGVGTPGLFTVADLCTLLYILRGLRASLMWVGRRAFPAQGPVAQVWGLDFVGGQPALVAGLFRTWVPGDLLSQHQLQACVEAMVAALPSPWQEAAKRWHAQHALRPQHDVVKLLERAEGPWYFSRGHEFDSHCGRILFRL